MITSYSPQHGLQQGGVELLGANPVWVDLMEPGAEEAEAVRHHFGVQVPTLSQMVEIEASSRLTRREHGLVIHTPILSNSTGYNPKADPVTFILTQHRLITVRYTTPRALEEFIATLRAIPTPEINSGDDMLLSILEAVVDRMADVLELIAADQDTVSRRIFHERTNMRRARTSSEELDNMMRTIGRGGDLHSKVRDTLMGLRRVINYLPLADLRFTRDSADIRLKTLSRDILSLNEYSDQLGTKIAFLLNATLGQISIQQNNIIKFFSVVAVLLMPPTLVASIYGMNFHHMPELDWTWGYPLALLVMLLVAVIPYVIFRRKGWL